MICTITFQNKSANRHRCPLSPLSVVSSLLPSHPSMSLLMKGSAMVLEGYSCPRHSEGQAAATRSSCPMFPELVSFHSLPLRDESLWKLPSFSFSRTRKRLQTGWLKHSSVVWRSKTSMPVWWFLWRSKGRICSRRLSLACKYRLWFHPHDYPERLDVYVSWKR